MGVTLIQVKAFRVFEERGVAEAEGGCEMGEAKGTHVVRTRRELGLL